MAAETMDEAAIFTIDAWCQRMLREHAFDSGSLFDEELVSDERALFEDARTTTGASTCIRWPSALGVLLGCWSDVGSAEGRACASWCSAPTWATRRGGRREPLAR
jgi:exodeoxyribonuclease V beta subunit